nr:MAG TPA: hypothetical protein [Caudoviricetes sp.]
MLQALFYEKNLSFLVKKCVFLLTNIRPYGILNTSLEERRKCL